MSQQPDNIFCRADVTRSAQKPDWPAADKAALDYIATRVARKFRVSAEVIAKRLRVEKLWPADR